jgi:hypothetical protein
VGHHTALHRGAVSIRGLPGISFDAVKPVFLCIFKSGMGVMGGRDQGSQSKAGVCVGRFQTGS